MAAQRAFDAQNRLFEQELENARGNEALQAEILEKQAQAERQFQQDQARREKQQAVFQSTLQALIALGLAASRGFQDPTLNLGAAQAAINAAVIAATPIPAFAE